MVNMYVLKLNKSKHNKDKYIEKHGHHFTEDLAKKAVSYMVNDNGDNHVFQMEFVKRWLLEHNYAISLFKNSTLGDIFYAANMAYADFYPKILKTEEDCLEFAIAMAKDVDGYEGLIFCRWFTDCKHKGIQIDWQEYIN